MRRAEQTEASAEAVLATYRRSRNLALRNRIVERFLPDVERIAQQMSRRLPASVDPHDLAQAGLAGLFQAIERYDDSRGVPFRSFLALRVRGAIRDELRASDHLTRRLRCRVARREAALRTLRQELGREPLAAEIAAALHVTPEQYQAEYAALQSNRLSQQLTPQGGGEWMDLAERVPDETAPDPGERLWQEEILRKVEEVLTPTELRLVPLHSFRGLRVTEVARELAVSKARICQIHGAVLAKLKRRLSRDPGR